MNIQLQITEQQEKLTTFRTLLKKEFSHWTAEETSQYGNKETLEVEKQLAEVSIKLLVVEDLFERGYTNWTSNEKDRYGSEKEGALNLLRKKEEQLRKKEGQLREQQTFLLRIKSTKLESDSSSQRISRIPTLGFDDIYIKHVRPNDKIGRRNT